MRYIDEVVFCLVQKIFELLASHKKTQEVDTMDENLMMRKCCVYNIFITLHLTKHKRMTKQVINSS